MNGATAVATLIERAGLTNLLVRAAFLDEVVGATSISRIHERHDVTNGREELRSRRASRTGSSDPPMILAFDAGTSSVKAVVASQSSQGGWVVHAYACSAHDPPDARGTGEAEQNPHSWWEALVRAVHMLSEQTDLDVVEAISLSGQMQSVILVDAAGAAVRTTLTLILTYGCGFARTMSS